jgi:hypothetical protein
MRQEDTRSSLYLGQGLYYLATGIWPLAHMGSFLRVTGPKTDVWLVKTVGVLVAAAGGVLAMAGARRKDSLELALLATATAGGLAGIDIYYAARGRISRVYLLDAVLELGLVAAWTATCPWRRA